MMRLCECCSRARVPGRAHIACNVNLSQSAPRATGKAKRNKCAAKVSFGCEPRAPIVGRRHRIPALASPHALAHTLEHTRRCCRPGAVCPTAKFQDQTKSTICKGSCRAPVRPRAPPCARAHPSPSELAFHAGLADLCHWRQVVPQRNFKSKRVKPAAKVRGEGRAHARRRDGGPGWAGRLPPHARCARLPPRPTGCPRGWSSEVEMAHCQGLPPPPPPILARCGPAPGASDCAPNALLRLRTRTAPLPWLRCGAPQAVQAAITRAR